MSVEERFPGQLDRLLLITAFEIAILAGALVLTVAMRSVLPALFLGGAAVASHYVLSGRLTRNVEADADSLGLTEVDLQS